VVGKIRVGPRHRPYVRRRSVSAICRPRCPWAILQFLTNDQADLGRLEPVARRETTGRVSTSASPPRSSRRPHPPTLAATISGSGVEPRPRHAPPASSSGGTPRFPIGVSRMPENHSRRLLLEMEQPAASLSDLLVIQGIHGSSPSWCRRQPRGPLRRFAGGASVGSCSRQERTTTAPPRRVVVVVVVLRAITEIEPYRAAGIGSSTPPVCGPERGENVGPHGCPSQLRYDDDSISLVRLM
jgi:hypothetical protein